jgi:hypothetical protein
VVWLNTLSDTTLASASRKPQGLRCLTLLVAVWLLAATAGLLLLADYSAKPGARGWPPQHWPVGVSLTRQKEKPTLVMFLHPRCPCSRASLSELTRLADDQPDRFAIEVVFVQPAGVGEDWSKSDLWDRAVANRNLQVVLDPGGELTRRFGVQTSGQVLVYDRTGVLQFDGGLTPGRGHVGDSFGRSRIQAIVAGQVQKEPATCATYGCSLTPKRAATAP